MIWYLIWLIYFPHQHSVVYVTSMFWPMLTCAYKINSQSATKHECPVWKPVYSHPTQTSYVVDTLRNAVALNVGIGHMSCRTIQNVEKSSGNWTGFNRGCNIGLPYGQTNIWVELWLTHRAAELKAQKDLIYVWVGSLWEAGWWGFGSG